MDEPKLKTTAEERDHLRHYYETGMWWTSMSEAVKLFVLDDIETLLAERESLSAKEIPAVKSRGSK